MGHTGIVQPDPGGKIGARLSLPAMQRRSAVLRSRLCGRSGLGVDAEARQREAGWWAHKDSNLGPAD